MRIIYDFLKWLPVAICTSAVAVAAVWSEAKDWISEQIIWGWNNLNNPMLALLVVLLPVIYVAGMIYAARPKVNSSPQENLSSQQEVVVRNDWAPPDFEIVLPPESRNFAIVGNAFQGTAKVNIGGQGHIIQDNEFGPNAQVRPGPREPANDMERRRALVGELVSKWVLLPGNVDRLPFRDVDAMYAETAPYINNELEARGLPWRLTSETREELGY